MEVPQAIKISWNQLRKRGIPGKTTMSQTHRWGMISPMSPAFRKIGIQYKCLACGKDFPSLIPDTRDHQCPYENIFRDEGIAFINAENVGINKIGAASDIVVLIVSVEGLHAIYRGEPTMHITDSKFVVPQKDLDPPPPVKLGASIGLDDMNNFAATLDRLLDSESAENRELRKHMKENYPVDGKNAERVANLLKAEMAKGNT